MKTNLSILLLLLFLLFGCTPPPQEIETSNEFYIPDYAKEIFVTTIDGCEYVVFNGTRKGGITHKGNCKNH